MNARRFKRGTLPPKLGKRTRRALIRLRHVKAREKFMRWAIMYKNLTSATPHNSHEWHVWHWKGCP